MRPNRKESDRTPVILSVAKDLALRFFSLLLPTEAKSRPQNDVLLGAPNCKKGITLIELIMAMVILVAISIPTAAMIGAQIQGMAEASDLTAAGNAARLVMEKLNNIPYASIATGIAVPGNSATVGPYTVTWDVTETGSGLIARKDITLTVKRGTGPALLTLNGSITNNVSYVRS